jgi:hypothetical protein
MPLTRGENHDYTIDYALGEVTFTNRVPIDSESRIEIDFEYSPESYPRNLYAGQVSSSTPDGRYRTTLSMFQEQDDADRPVGFDIRDSDRNALSEAGDSKSALLVYAADSLGPGQGDYVRFDTTTTDSTPIRAFRFSMPDEDGSPTGSWQVPFAADPGGSYERVYTPEVGAYRYRWVGSGLGSYSPGRSLTLPERMRHGSWTLQAEPNDRISLSIELGLSDHDLNTRSALDDEDNTGLAQQYELTLRPFGDGTASPLQLTARVRDEGARYSSPGRTREVDYERKWAVEQDQSSGAERERVLEAAAMPITGLMLNGGLAQLERGEYYRGERSDAELNWEGENSTLRTGAELVRSDNSLLEESSDWLRSELVTGVQLGLLRPGFEGSFEERSASRGQQWIGHRISRTKLTLGIVQLNDHRGDLYVNSGYRSEEQTENKFNRVWDERGAGGRWFWSPRNLPLNQQLELSVRGKTYVGGDSSDVTSRLARWSVGAAPLAGAFTADWQYRLSRTVTRPRVLIAYTVPEGEGDYIRINEEYVYDPEIGDIILRPEPTGEALPTTDVAATLNLDWSPHRLPGGAGVIDGFGWEDISLASQLEVVELSRLNDPLKIALLTPSSLLTDSTLEGRVNLRQDLYLYRTSREFSTRIRYESDATRVDRYGTGAEERSSDSWGLRVRAALNRNLDSETLLDWSREHKRLARRSSGEQFALLSGSEELSWRMNTRWVLRFRVRSGYDREQVENIEVRTLGLRPGFTYALGDRGRLTADSELTWVVSETQILPYELAEGRPVGRNGRVNLRGDLRMGENMTARAYYTVRMDEGREPIHLARVEASAFF